MLNTRTAMTKRNAAASLVNRVVILFCNFIGRSIFISVLSKEYLGAGGMFGNVFSVLSLLELGFGEAASQAMYKPLAEGNMDTVRRIVKYFSKVYRYVALVNVTAAIAIMPFLTQMFPDVVKIEGYRAVYALFVLHQTLGYLFAPKRSLVLCDQRMYVVMLSGTVCSVFMTATQIFFLVHTRDYLIYVFLRIFFCAVSGLVTEIYADRRYGFHGADSTCSLSDDIKRRINGNTLALAVHKIGGVINNSTYSILLSSYLGLSHMGIFSNYSLIINSIGSFISLAVSSAGASIGNLGAGENGEKSKRVLEILTFANFYLLTNCAAALLLLLNPVIALWIGEDMCFSTGETAVIIACFYMSYIRDPVQLFLKGYGVFKSTKYISLIRGLMNLALSYMFVKKLGVAGVFAGTLISTVAVPFLTEPYMLFKHGFKLNCGCFLLKYTGYVLCSAAVCVLSFFAVSGMPCETLAQITVKGIVTVALVNLVLLIVFGRSLEMKELVVRILYKFSKKQ